MIKKYQINALQQVEKSADNDDVFDHEMSTYYTLLDKRNRITSTDIVIVNSTEWEEHNNLINRIYIVTFDVLLWIYNYY